MAALLTFRANYLPTKPRKYILTFELQKRLAKKNDADSRQLLVLANCRFVRKATATFKTQNRPCVRSMISCGESYIQFLIREI
jgi:hypothetical protein